MRVDSGCSLLPLVITQSMMGSLIRDVLNRQRDMTVVHPVVGTRDPYGLLQCGHDSAVWRNNSDEINRRRKEISDNWQMAKLAAGVAFGLEFIASCQQEKKCRIFDFMLSTTTR